MTSEAFQKMDALAANGDSPEYRAAFAQFERETLADRTCPSCGDTVPVGWSLDDHFNCNWEPRGCACEHYTGERDGRCRQCGLPRSESPLADPYGSASHKPV